MGPASLKDMWAVILAGGASARFWPLDGDTNPKYLLRPNGGSTLLELAWERCLRITSPDRILVVTGESQAKQLSAHLPSLDRANLLVEPSRRDTLPAIGLAMAEISRRTSESPSDELVIVTPSDTFLAPDSALADALAKALVSGVFSTPRNCCFTIPASLPNTGFGYLRVTPDPLAAFLPVLRFVEKPDAERAAQYVASGDYHWNSGSFALSLKAFERNLETRHSGMWRSLLDCAAHLASSNRAGALAAFESCTRISIDFGMMEHAEAVIALPVTGEFDDVGTWDALASRGGLRAGGFRDATTHVIEVDSPDCAVAGSGVVAFIDCPPLIVVREGDKTLVMAKGSGQKVRIARDLADSPPFDGPSPSLAAAPIPPSLDRRGIHMGIDYGDVRTGLALSDDLGLLATPLVTIREEDPSALADTIASLCRDHRVERIVIGIAYNMDGTEGLRARKTRELAAMLAERGAPSVEFQDERLTSWEADAKLKEAGHFGKKRKDRIDMAAAVAILSSWLADGRPDSVRDSSAESQSEDPTWQKRSWPADPGRAPKRDRTKRPRR